MTIQDSKPTNKLRNYLAPFTNGYRAWLVLARNALPVVGVYLLGWSDDVAVFQIWYSGITALGIMLAFHIWAFTHSDDKVLQTPPGILPGLLPRIMALVWFLIWLLLGIPYWFVLFFLNFTVFEDGFWTHLLLDPGVILTLLLVLANNAFVEYKRGYERMSATESRREFNWDFNMHLLRIAAMILVGFWLRPILIVGLAFALSYVEIYPMRALRFFGGDRTLEAANENRSPD